MGVMSAAGPGWGWGGCVCGWSRHATLSGQAALRWQREAAPGALPPPLTSVLRYCRNVLLQYHLKRCGVRHLYYLVEGDPDTLRTGGAGVAVGLLLACAGLQPGLLLLLLLTVGGSSRGTDCCVSHSLRVWAVSLVAATTSLQHRRWLAMRSVGERGDGGRHSGDSRRAARPRMLAPCPAPGDARAPCVPVRPAHVRVCPFWRRGGAEGGAHSICQDRGGGWLHRAAHLR